MEGIEAVRAGTTIIELLLIAVACGVPEPGHGL
jgi:hypothetical protein